MALYIMKTALSAALVVLAAAALLPWKPSPNHAERTFNIRVWRYSDPDCGGTEHDGKWVALIDKDPRGWGLHASMCALVHGAHKTSSRGE